MCRQAYLSLSQVVLLVTLSSSTTCLAHGFQAQGMAASGWLHPLTGSDHMLAMIAVGAWSAQLGGAALYLVPSAFVTAMAVGGAVGLSHVPIPAVEFIISLSVLVLGAAIAQAGRAALPVAAATTLLFGAAHGYSHGTEVPQSADAVAYVAGFLSTTATLHIIGLVTGLILLGHTKGRCVLRLAGAGTAVAGLMFVAGLATTA